MYKYKSMIYMILIVTLLGLMLPVSGAMAASPVDTVVKTLAASSAPDGGGGLLDKVFDLLFNKILGPIFHALGGKSSSPASILPPVKVTPLPSSPDSGPLLDSGVLRGKVIVLDPGHGGSNPGAVDSGIRESDVNLAVALKLRDKLANAGAKVIMTRETDRTVAPEGQSLGQELQARVDIAEANHADIFVSLHSNENADSALQGAMTFYRNGDPSSDLALNVQSSLVKETGAVDKGTSPATFYVLRNTTMPGILVEMGFVSNADEAARLQNGSYQKQLVQGIASGIVRYFNQH